MTNPAAEDRASRPTVAGTGCGPLAGLRVLELGGIGPVPFAAMMFADHGASVIRIERPGTRHDPSDVIARGRRRLAVDIKSEAGRDRVLRLADRADAVIEGFRPGVAERLGLGPDTLMARNPRLVYGRMTGWGQTGPRAGMPGHDINYIGLVGALHATGLRDRPVIPLNLVGDFGGGALYLAFGLLAAIRQAGSTGQGQVIDCAMMDGAASLMSMLFGHLTTGYWLDRRESNTIDGGAHFYNVYQCADGKWLAVGAVEPKFYANLLAGMGIGDAASFPQRDRARWPDLTERFREIFRSRARDDWLAVLEHADACVTPVHSMAEAPEDPHSIARGLFSRRDEVLHPAPAPRFSSVPVQDGNWVEAPAEAIDLSDWGIENTGTEEGSG